MSSYIIEGGNRLEGEAFVSGSKNASLPIMAAAILNGGTTTLYNVPKIHDTKMTMEILKSLGCKIKESNSKIVIDSSEMKITEIPDSLMREMRSSVILAGAILGRFKEVTFSHPGGCDIGARPIDLHLEGFKKLGINIAEDSGFIRCSCDRIKGAKIQLDFPSVGATENIMLASVLGEGKTVIKNVAREPEIIDLQNMLNSMGAKITGAGSNCIKIMGVKELKDTKYTIICDRIEAGTLLCATAITGGIIQLKNVIPDYVDPILHKLEECGCKIDVKKDSVCLKAPKKLLNTTIKTMPYPGFPTDMQSVFGSILTVSKGTSVIIENIFENRYKYTNELARMGAKITVEGKVAIIEGVTRLSGATVNSPDLRGGASLVIAGLIAKGETTVNNIEHILRGYEGLDKKLNKLGANIKQIK